MQYSRRGQEKYGVLKEVWDGWLGWLNDLSE